MENPFEQAFDYEKSPLFTLVLVRQSHKTLKLSFFFNRTNINFSEWVDDSKRRLGSLLGEDSRKYVSGYIVLLGNSPISWKSNKQETISLSSAEAEYRALRKVVDELVWLDKLLEELSIPISRPIEVYCDSQSALRIVKNPMFHERTKHIEVDCHFVRNMLQEGLISLHHISSENQLADVLTKALTDILLPYHEQVGCFPHLQLEEVLRLAFNI